MLGASPPPPPLPEASRCSPRMAPPRAAVGSCPTSRESVGRCASLLTQMPLRPYVTHALTYMPYRLKREMGDGWSHEESECLESKGRLPIWRNVEPPRENGATAAAAGRPPHGIPTLGFIQSNNAFTETAPPRLRDVGLLRNRLRLVTTRVIHNTIVYQYRSCTLCHSVVTGTRYTFSYIQCLDQSPTRASPTATWTARPHRCCARRILGGGR